MKTLVQQGVVRIDTEPYFRRPVHYTGQPQPIPALTPAQEQVFSGLQALLRAPDAQAALLFGTVIKTLPMKLGSFAASYTNLYGTTGSHSTVNEAISLAGTFLSILPLLVLYIIMQKQFVESIEKVGITGE